MNCFVCKTQKNLNKKQAHALHLKCMILLTKSHHTIQVVNCLQEYSKIKIFQNVFETIPFPFFGKIK